MKYVFSVLFALLPVVAMADENCATLRDVPDKELSIQEVVELGLCRNPQTASAYASLRAARYNKNRSYASYLPSASIGYSFSNSYAGSQFDDWSHRGPSISASYLLFDFGKRLADLNESLATYRATGFDYDETIQNYVYSVVGAYYELLKADADVSAATSALKVAKNANEMASKKFKAGAVAKADVYKSETTLAGSELTLERAKNNREIAKGNLLTKLSFPADQQIKIADMPSTFGSNAEIANNNRTVLLYSSLFIVWIVACLVAVSQGTRFIQTLVIPIGLLAGIFVGYAGDYVKANIDDKKMLFAIAFFASALVAFPITQLINVKLPNPMLLGIAIFAILLAISLVVIYGFSSLKDADISIKKTLVVVLITIALISPTVCGAYQVAENTVPGSSDPMWNAMDFIKENTTSNSVIVSWWDFGYLFQIASDHSTSFDGGSQTGDRAFWVGRLLSTPDLNLAKGILQMLTTTGDNATNLLCDYTGSNATAVDALIKVLPMSKDKAKSTLVKDYNLTSTQATNVVKQSHPAHPNKVELVLSSDMIQKAGWWSYFGSWDFDKLNSTNYQYYVSQNSATISPNSEGKIPILEDNGIVFNAVIDRGAKNNTQAHTEAVFANNGSEVDVNGTKYNPLNASNVMIVEDNYLVENTTLNNDGQYTLFVIGQQGSYSAILMDNHIKDSLFTKLYILGGAGQDTFKLEDMEPGVAVWTINS